MFLIGATTAWLAARPAPLVTPASGDPRVRLQKSILLQYLQAARLNSPEAWQAVVRFTPTNEYYVKRAKQQLIRIHLSQGQYDLALALCDELRDESEAEFRAFGLAGRAIALTGKEDYAASFKTVRALSRWPSIFTTQPCVESWNRLKKETIKP